MSVVQAALLGLTAILFAAQLKPLKPEYAVYLVLAASIGIGFLGLAKLGVLLETLPGDRKRDPDPACVFDNTSPDGGVATSRSSRLGSVRVRDIGGGDTGGDGGKTRDPGGERTGCSVTRGVIEGVYGMKRSGNVGDLRC